MPPILALILCSIFVIFLLRLDRKQYPEASFALWVPTIWFLSTTSKPLAIWFNFSGGDMESGSPLDRTFLIILLCIGLFILFKRKFNMSKAITNNLWLLLLLSFWLLSIAWSDMPFTSFKRWVRELPPVIMAFIVLTETSPRLALECLLRRTMYILIPFSVMLIKYYPHFGVDFGRWSGALSWIGVTTQKNGLASLCKIGIIFLIWTLYRRWQGRDISVAGYQTYLEIFLLLLTLWLFTGPSHTFAYSATSTVSLSIGLIAFWGLCLLKKWNIYISATPLAIIVSITIIYGIITPFVGGLSVVDVSSAFGRKETLTGRADIWAKLLPYAMQHPILGHGFGGFWTDAMRAMTSSHAHNGALDIILVTGFVGMALISIFLLSSAMRARKLMKIDFDWGMLWSCLIIMAVVHNIAESAITSFSSYIVATLLLFYVTVQAQGTPESEICRSEDKT